MLNLYEFYLNGHKSQVEILVKHIGFEISVKNFF